MRSTCLLILLFVLTSNVFSQDREIAPVTEEKIGDDFNAEQIIEMNKPALVSIWFHMDNFYDYYTYASKDTTLLNGSGFIFDEKGSILTLFYLMKKSDSSIFI